MWWKILLVLWALCAVIVLFLMWRAPLVDENQQVIER